MMKRLCQIFCALAGMTLSGCSGCLSPLGELVDPELSESWFHHRMSNAIVYSPLGNWLKLGVTRSEADPRSFRVLASNIGVDDERVYYRGVTQEISSDGFVVEDLVVRDRDHVYKPSDRTQLTPLEHADPATFEYLFPESTNPRLWARDARRYFYGRDVVDVDYESFEFINDNFAADGTRIYSTLPPRPLAARAEPLEPITAFHLLSGPRLIINAPTRQPVVLDVDAEESVTALGEHHVRVGDQVLYQDQVIENADAETFETLNARDHARDARRVYFRGDRLALADPQTFEVLDGFYSRDAERIYYTSSRLEDADPETFETFRERGWVYGRDRHGVFRGSERDRRGSTP